MARLAAVLLSVMVVAGCETVERPSYGDVKKVGVASLAGNVIYHTRHIPFLGDDTGTNFIHEWRLARYIESLVTEYIHQYGAAQVVPLDIDHPRLFVDYHDPSPGMFGDRFNYARVAATIEEAARTAGVDTYLTVEPMDKPRFAPMLAGGLGFYSDRRLFYQQDCFYNLMRISVWRVGQPAPEYGIYSDRTCIRTDIEWQRRIDDYDESTQRAIEAGLKSVIASDVQSILYSLGFFKSKPSK